MTRIKRIYADFFGWMVLVDCREKERRFNGLNGFTRIFFGWMGFVDCREKEHGFNGLDGF